MKVLSALSASRNFTIAWATSCGCDCRNCLVKEGAPLAVGGYVRVRAGKTCATEAFAHGSMCRDVLSLMNFFSSKTRA